MACKPAVSACPGTSGKPAEARLHNRNSRTRSSRTSNNSRTRSNPLSRTSNNSRTRSNLVIRSKRSNRTRSNRLNRTRNSQATRSNRSNPKRNPRKAGVPQRSHWRLPWQLHPSNRTKPCCWFER